MPTWLQRNVRQTKSSTSTSNWPPPQTWLPTLLGLRDRHRHWWGRGPDRARGELGLRYDGGLPARLLDTAWAADHGQPGCKRQQCAGRARRPRGRPDRQLPLAVDVLKQTRARTCTCTRFLMHARRLLSVFESRSAHTFHNQTVIVGLKMLNVYYCRSHAYSAPNKKCTSWAKARAGSESGSPGARLCRGSHRTHRARPLPAFWR